MADYASGAMIVSLLFFLLLCGMPIAFALMGSGICGLLLMRGWGAAEFTLSTFPYSYVSNLSLVVVPLFLLMGNVAFSAGLSHRAFAAARLLLGNLPGGLAMAVVFGCAAFATVCGSSVATAVTMGRIGLPEMLKAGYRPWLASGCVAAGGTLGVLIPPSGVLVLYSIATQVSIVDLFVAAFIPGVLTALIYVIGIYVMVRIRPELAPVVETVRLTRREKLKTIAGAWEVVALFLVVMGTIYLGVGTATEASAFGAVFAIVLLLARGTGSKLTELKFGLVDAAGTTASVFALVIGAGLFSLALATTQVPGALAGLVASLDVPPTILVALLLLPYLVLGCFLDGISMILLTMPIVFPIIQKIGYNPVIFGLLITKAVEIGAITPPVGLNAFAVKGIAPEVPLSQIFKGCVPFVIMEIGIVALLLIFPEISLWLLRTMQ
jgi:tripartite ATP-independent transporter DctM subunit